MSSPAFQFYPAEFLADENVALMTNQELGCYVKLICYCWREGSIPAEVPKIAKLCGEDGSAMAQLWPSLSPCFEPSSADITRLIHPRLEKERKKQETNRQERAEAGKKGAKRRWDSKPMAQPSTPDSSAIAQPSSSDGSVIDFLMAKDASLSSTSTSVEVDKGNTPAVAGDELGEMFWANLQRQYPDVNMEKVRQKMKSWLISNPSAKMTTSLALTFARNAKPDQIPLLAVTANEKATIANRESAFEESRREMQRLAEEARRKREQEESGEMYVEDAP